MNRERPTILFQAHENLLQKLMFKVTKALLVGESYPKVGSTGAHGFSTKAQTMGPFSKSIFRSFVGCQEGRRSILARECEPGKPGYACCHAAWAMGLVL